MVDAFRFPIALGLLAQRSGIEVAARKAKKWATAPVTDKEAIDYASHCLHQFRKASEEKKLEREGAL